MIITPSTALNAQTGNPICQISYAGSWVDNSIGYVEFGFSWQNTTPGSVLATFAVMDQVYTFSGDESYEQIQLQTSPSTRVIASLLIEAANGECYITAEKVVPEAPGQPAANPPVCQVSYHFGWLDQGSGHAEFGFSWYNTVQGTVNATFDYLGQQAWYTDWEAYYQVYSPAAVDSNPVGRLTVLSENGACIATGIARVPSLPPPPLPPCPSGYGSRTGIYPGDYDIDRLNNEFGVEFSTQIRQDLFEMFGNSGSVPVGYGGERCEGGHVKWEPIYFYEAPPAPLQSCPSGYGPRTGIYPGDYDSNRLVQDFGEPMATNIRQDLFEMFGNSGQVPVGYAGERCQGGHEKGQPILFNNPPVQPTPVPPTGMPTNTPPPPIPNPTGASSSEPVITVPLQYFGTTYNFLWNRATCEILNGSEIVAQEATRFWQVYESHPNDLAKINFAVQYFGVNDGGIEGFRFHIENNLHGEINGVPFSCTKVYKVGSHTMDMSGLGNIVFGYFASQYPVIFEDTVANIDQGVNQYSRWIFVDNPDDLTQRRTGRKMAELAGYQASVAPWTVEQAADQEGLW